MSNSNQPSRSIYHLNWFYGWNALALSIFAVAMSMGIIFSSFTFFVLAWMDEFGVDRGEAMITLAITQLLSGVVNPFSGRAMDRWSIRWVGVGGLLFLGVGLFLVSLATALWQVMVIYAVFLSVAFAMAGPILAQTMAAKWFRKRRGFAIGLASIGSSIGGFLFPPLAAVLLEAIGWRETFWVLALIVLLVGVPAFALVVRNSPEDKGVEPEPENPVQAKRPATDNNWTTRGILTNGSFWIFVACFLPIIFMTSGVIINLGPYSQDLNIDTSSAAILMSVWSLAMIIGKLLFGMLTDRYSHHLIYFFVIGSFALCMFVLSINPNLFILLGVIVVLGLVAGGQMPLLGAMISNYFGAIAFGSAMGLYNLCIRPVAFAGPLGGWLRDTYGSYDVFWLGGMVAILVFGPLVLRLER